MNTYAKKSLAVITGLLLSIFLWLLPTTVVNDKTLEIPDNQDQQPLARFNHEASYFHSDPYIDSLRRILKSKAIESQLSIYAALVAAFESDKRYDSALLYMHRLYIKDSSLVRLDQLSSLYFQAFRFAIQKDRVDFFRTQAQVHLQKLLDQKKTPETQIRLGLTYVSSQTPMQGILMIRSVLEQHPNNLFALRTMGDLALQSNQLEKAVTYFSRYIALDSSDALIYYYLGASHKQLNNTLLAVKYLLKAQELSEDKRLLTDIEKMLQD